MSITLTLPDFTLAARLGDQAEVKAPPALNELLLAVACEFVPGLGVALNVAKLAQLLAAGVASARQR